MTNRPHTLITASALSLLAVASPVSAKSHDIQIVAVVPTQCSADLVEGPAGNALGGYSLGQVRQFCNTRYRLSVRHDPLAPGSYFTLGAAAANSVAGEAVLKPSADPAAYVTEELAIHGVDDDEALRARSALVLTVAPIAF